MIAPNRVQWGAELFPLFRFYVLPRSVERVLPNMPALNPAVTEQVRSDLRRPEAE